MELWRQLFKPCPPLNAPGKPAQYKGGLRPYCVTLPAVSACVRRLLVLNLHEVLCCTIYMQEIQYMNVEDWKSQIKRGTLDFCILLLIKQRPYYGYEIISKLEQYPIVLQKKIQFIHCLEDY